MKNKGITLIALVITVVVLIILSGITIALVMGDNGLIQRTITSGKEYQKEAIEEKIRLLMAEVETEKILGNIEEYIGNKLVYNSVSLFYSKLSVYDFQEEKRYAEGWYLLEEGFDLLGYEMEEPYMVNYETGEIINISDKERYYIARGGNVCITEDLVYTVDSTNIGGEGNNWGDMLLHNFNTDISKSESLHSGWTESALLFDGVNDGIEKPDTTDYTNGITLEMYFKMEGQVPNQIVQILFMKRKITSHGFFMAIGNQNAGGSLPYSKLMIDIGGANHRISNAYTIPEGEDVYITYTFDNKAKQGILYINGIEVLRSSKGDTSGITSSLDAPIQIGADVYQTNGAGNTYPLYGRIYASRIYNRALTEKEVKYNYTNTTGIEL